MKACGLQASKMSEGKLFHSKHRVLRRKGREKSFLINLVFLTLVVYIFQNFRFQFPGRLNAQGEVGSSVQQGGRHLLWTSNQTTLNESKKTCNPPSIQEFPNDVFTDEQRSYGAVILHIIGAVYMFLALAFVCDDYFVASLDKICEHLDLTEDVAGATFMAAGSSAPELFTSVIGVFVAHGDIGSGTIIGSAVFNILVILSLVGVCAGQAVKLTRWPLFRDSISYTLAVAALIVVMYDGHIAWYESVCLLLMYIFYCLLMKFNKTILDFISKQSAEKEKRKPKRADEDGFLNIKSVPDYSQGTEEINLYNRRERRLTWREVGMMIMLTEKFTPASRFRAAGLIVKLRKEEFKGNSNEESNHERASCIIIESEAENNSDDDGDQREVGEVFASPRGSIFKVIYWYISLPIIALLHFTIPDCKTPRWERWFMMTFLVSVLWIAIFSYVMVWMVTIIGYTFGIPDVIMGITFLAAGTSIPDAIASLIVARQGQGDMAVSNSIGSNVFDILIGLAVPWLIKTTMYHPGSTVSVNSRGLVYSVMLLFASVVITVLSIHLNKWKLDRKVGFFLLIMYFIFITFSCLIEFNIFGFVNLPTCKVNR